MRNVQGLYKVNERLFDPHKLHKICRAKLDISTVKLRFSEEFDKNFWSSYNEEDEQRMNIIGQNGNDGEHYEDEKFNDLDLNKDGIIDENERSIAENKIKELEKKIKPGVSGFRVNKFKEEINKIKKSLEK